jgi:hypothetical protein
MMAEEECALNSHETKNTVCCAKHHLEVPCPTCLENEKLVKQAVEAKKAEEQQAKKDKEEQMK